MRKLLLLIYVFLTSCTGEIPSEFHSESTTKDGATSLRAIDPETLFIDLSINGDQIYTKRSFNSMQSLSVDIQIQNSEIFTTPGIAYEVYVGFYVKLRNESSYNLIANTTQDITWESDSDVQVLDLTKYEYPDLNPYDEIPDVHQYGSLAATPIEVNVNQGSNRETTARIGLISVDADISTLVNLSALDELFYYYYGFGSTFDGNIQEHNNTNWYVYTAERAQTPSCPNGLVANTISAVWSFVGPQPHSIMFYGQKDGVNYLVGPVADVEQFGSLFRINTLSTIEDVANQSNILDDSIRMILVRENSAGSLRAYQDSQDVNFSGLNYCTINLTSPPLNDPRL